MIVLFLFLVASVQAQMICNGGSITEEVRIAFLLVHNQLRSAIAQGRFTANGTMKPAASNMLELNWNCTLEASAQLYANSCPDDHSGKEGAGENLFAEYSSDSIDDVEAAYDASAAWAQEFEDFGWTSNIMTMDLANLVGHATQMSWATTSSVGCGVAHCLQDGLEGVNIVCQYWPPGNYLAKPVYLTGEVCSACPADTTCNKGSGLCSHTGPTK